MNQAAEPLLAESSDDTIPLPETFKRKLRKTLVALSLANLVFIRAWFAALYDADFGYYNKVPVGRTMLLALATNIAWFAVLTWLVMRLLRVCQKRWVHLAFDLLFFAVLLVPLDFVRGGLLGYPLSRVLAYLQKPFVAVAAGAALVLILWQHRKVARGLALAVGLLSPLALFVIARICLLLLGLEHLKQPGGEPSLAPLSAVRPNHPRVLWVIFDETDQRLVFEQRPAGIKIPEFDRLCAESLAATNAYPPGNRTMFSMPALISGERFSAIRLKDSSDATIIRSNSTPTTWRQLPSVFASARELGVNTALVGWYHPYARVLGKGLNYCAWYPFQPTEPARGATYGEAIWRQILCPAGPVYWRHLQIDLCRTMLMESATTVTNDNYGLVLLHLPLPHKPGVYNPETDRFTHSVLPETTEYFNNLILADHFLGTLRRAMEASGDWDKTWIILSSDHSWRWSDLYDGRRDLRVPFLVKVPGSAKPATYSPRMNTLLTHDLILAILRGELHDSAELTAWLDAHRSELPPVDD